MVLFAPYAQYIPKSCLAGILSVTAVYAIANLVADLLYAFFNPRIRYGRAAA